VKDEDSDEPLIAYDLLFTPSFFDSSLLNSVFFESISSSFLFYSLFPEQQISSDVHISGSSYSVFGELFNKMYLEFTNRERGYINIIRAYVTELIVKIFRKMESSQSKDVSTNQKQVVNSTLSYLRKNYQKQISLDELAAEVFLSKDYFSRLFRETTGMPTSAFLQKIRVEEACNLLSTTNIAIKDVAQQCGFHDIKYFYSIFKKLTGETPRQYRIDSKKD
jgi:YesN/AraC family two-component response regulator